jgi:hypothetical protein
MPLGDRFFKTSKEVRPPGFFEKIGNRPGARGLPYRKLFSNLLCPDHCQDSLHLECVAE